MSRRDPPGHADRSGLWGPAGHALVTGGLAVAGAGAGAAWGAPPVEAWTGVSLAWAIQVVAVWRLQAAVAGGRAATRAWVGGMAARLAGLGVVAVAAWSTALDGAAMAVAYVAAVIPLLWLEGLWLHRSVTPARDPEAATDQRPDRSDGRDE